MIDHTLATCIEVALERKAQDKKWGEQNHDPFLWLSILQEEVGEVAEAALEARGAWANEDRADSEEMALVAKSAAQRWQDNYRQELIQVAAVAVAMVECFDRNVRRDQ